MERFKHKVHLLSMVQTCRRHGRSAITFFEQALKASAIHRDSCPSLTPTSIV